MSYWFPTEQQCRDLFHDKNYQTLTRIYGIQRQKEVIETFFVSAISLSSTLVFFNMISRYTKVNVVLSLYFTTIFFGIYQHSFKQELPFFGTYKAEYKPNISSHLFYISLLGGHIAGAVFYLGYVKK